MQAKFHTTTIESKAKKLEEIRRRSDGDKSRMVDFTQKDKDNSTLVKKLEHKKKEISQQKREIKQKIEKLKSEIAASCSTSSTKINTCRITKKTKKLPVRVSLADILDIVENKYGHEKLIDVVNELHRLHVSNCPIGTQLKISFNDKKYNQIYK